MDITVVKSGKSHAMNVSCVLILLCFALLGFFLILTPTVVTEGDTHVLGTVLLAFDKCPHSTFRACCHHPCFGSEEVKAFGDSKTHPRSHQSKRLRAVGTQPLLHQADLVNLFRNDFDIPIDWPVSLSTGLDIKCSLTR